MARPAFEADHSLLDDVACRATILVVEDDPGLREMMAQVLRHLGFADVATCGDVASAERWCIRRAFDLVIVDLRLAGRSGLEFVARLRREHPLHDPMVVVMTGESHAASIRGAWAAGADDVVIKPFDPSRLGKRLRTLLRLRAHALFARKVGGWMGSQTYLEQ